jgi:hypothetical protein
VRQVWPALDERGHVIPASLGHPDISEHDIGPFDRDTRDGLFAISDGDDLHILSRERQLDDALNRYAVIGEQEFVRHGPLS